MRTSRAALRNLADLVDERWVLPAAPLFLRQWLEARFADAGLPSPRVAAESSPSLTTFVELLRRSDLLGLLPPPVLHQAEGIGLAALEGVGLSWTHELAVCWRRWSQTFATRSRTGALSAASSRGDGLR